MKVSLHGSKYVNLGVQWKMFGCLKDVRTSETMNNDSNDNNDNVEIDKGTELFSL